MISKADALNPRPPKSWPILPEPPKKLNPRAISSITHCRPTTNSRTSRIVSFILSGAHYPLNMSMAVSRAVLRRSAKLPFGRTPARFESTASKASEAAKDTASKASEKASDFQSKASQGLSRVSSAAGPAISGAAKGLGNALGKIGGRTGRLIAFIERE